MATITSINVWTTADDWTGDTLRAWLVKVNTNTDNLNTDKLETSEYTAADVKTKYESNADTNSYTDAEQTKLWNISWTNTWDQIISDATITTTDITTNDATAAKHWFLPKLSNVSTEFLDWTGNYSTPAGWWDMLSTNNLSDVDDIATSRDNLWINAENILKLTWEVDLEPTWFENRTDSQLWLIDVSRTLYVEPVVDDFTVWVKGKKYTFDSRQSTIVPDVSWTYMAYIDEDWNIQNRLISTITETNFLSSTFICYAYWNSTLQTFLRTTPWEERHWMVMDWATHYRLHLDDWAKIRRTQWGAKLWHQLTDIIADWNWDLDSSITFWKDSWKISDEDLVIDIPAKLTTWNIPLYYKLSWVWFVEENQYALKNATWGRLQYNDLTTIWSETINEVSNLDFMLIHHWATNWWGWEPIAFMGQAVYTTRWNARDWAETELNNLVTSWLPWPEIVFTHSVIYQTATAYDNTHKARIISTDNWDDFIDWRSSALNWTWWVSLPSSSASDISVDITNFDNNLSSADTDVQKALETIDDLIIWDVTGGWTATWTNTWDVTLAWTPDYITISGQVITRNDVNLTTDITWTLPVANWGTWITTDKLVTSTAWTPTWADRVIDIVSLTSAEYTAATKVSTTLYFLTT